MSMRKELHIGEDDLIQYALGTLPDAQLYTLTAHISMCGTCREELARTQEALASYSSTIPLEEPPQGSRERFFARAMNPEAPKPRAGEFESGNTLAGKLKAFAEWLISPVPVRVFAGALAAVLVFVVFDDISNIRVVRQLQIQTTELQVDQAKLNEIEGFLRGNDTVQVSLHEKPGAVKAPEGHAVYSSRSGKLIFTAENLPAPPSGKAYELWILPASGGAPIPAGVFTPDAQGKGGIVFPSVPENVVAAGFGITVEDAAGSLAPTSAIILSGQ
jgi:anti-sigma-K factor RskA